MEPRWLVLARELQAMSQIGLAYTSDHYDRARYERIRELAALMMADGFGADVRRLENAFAAEVSYATPKIDVRAAVFHEGRILLVQEIEDQGRWSLPGGWADVNQSASECVAREVQEESGFEVTVRKLAAVYDQARHPHPPQFPFHVYKMFFICEITGGAARPGPETGAAAFFAEHALPELSEKRVLASQIHRMFEHLRMPGLAAEFD